MASIEPENNEEPTTGDSMTETYDHMHEPSEISELVDCTIQESMLSMVDLDQEEASMWIDEKELQHEKRGILNDTIIHLSDGRNSPVSSTLNTSWEDVSKTQQNYYIRKAKEVVQTALSVIVPGQEEKLWNCLRHEGVCADKGNEPATKKSRLDTSVVDTLISAYEEADNGQTKRQILSLFANDFSKSELQQMIPGISKWRIDSARRHAIDVGVGQPPIEQPIYRARLDPVKTDHFIDFISRPCFLQDVAYGTRKLKLDSGGHAVIPAVIRTLIPSRIIVQYKSYCSDIEFEPASERTLFRILEVCSASMQKSLHGLDYLITEGVQAFESLESIVETLRTLGNVSESWYDQCKLQLKNGKKYLKSDFKLHVGDQERSADHCIVFALNDTIDSCYRKTCYHTHEITCDACQEIDVVIQEITRRITDESFTTLDDGTRARLMFQHDHSKAAIIDWKAHNVRTVNQEMAKQDVLSNLSPNSCLIVMDWAMKFLPMYYREHMRNFFGKRGKSWHVSAVIVKQDGGYIVHCYVHIFENCTQDWFTVASIVEHLLETIKIEQPHITEAYLRSDNGACYHNAPLMFALPSIGTRTGVTIKRYDFSEPQSGKDICDRKIAPMKAHIRRHVNEKNDVTTASDMKKALESHGGVRGCKATVVAVNTATERGRENKLKGISKLNNFEFKDEGIQVWRAYNVGNGKCFSLEGIQPQGKTSLIIIEPFGATQPSSLISRPIVPKQSSKAEVFFCALPGCVLTFTSESDAEAHMDTGTHKLVPEKESLYDSLRRKWAQNVGEIVSKPKEGNVENVNKANENSLIPDECNEKGALQGWALKCQKTGSKTSPNVKAFLIEKFNEGLKRGQKANPANVSKEMQTVKGSQGFLLFNPEEWKTERQIANFFSRLTALQRNQVHPVTTNEEDNFDEEECEAIQEETASQNLRDAVYEAVDIGHPLIFEGLNICEMTMNNKLTDFKVAELDGICRLYGLEIDGSRKRKLPYVNSITTFVKECSCFK